MSKLPFELGIGPICSWQLQNLKTSEDTSGHDMSPLKLESTSSKTWIFYQELICTNPPLYAIKEIQFNASEDQIALIGQNGIAVMTLPRRWGSSGLYEDGKQKILCK